MMRATNVCHFLRSRRGAFLALAVLVLGFPALAEPPDPPPYYAVRGATVVTGTGTTLEDATVVIADGLIEAVGKDVIIPGDAWVIDGKGLFVYPGLIDAMTNLGQVEAEESQPQRPRGGGGPGGGGGEEPEIRGPEDRPLTTPWKSAAFDLNKDDPRLKTWREAGFTAAVTVPDEGFFPGQAAVIVLGGDEPADMVVAASVAQRVDYTFRTRGYPGSLMGKISYVKQVLSDALHYGEAERLYHESPQGAVRPAYDRTLDPLRHAMDEGRPFLVPAHISREIDRVTDLAGEVPIHPVIYGGQGAYDRIDALRKSKTPVLVSLDWPEDEKDRDPDATTDVRTLYHQRMAPATPKLLAEAGVAFALYSDGISAPSKVFENVRKAIGEGLSSEAALKALTLSPARIFGVDDVLGSIEAGKIANLVVATAEPWAEGVEVKAVFVDGRKYQEHESAEPTEPPASDVSGTWSLTLESPRGTREMTAELKMSADGKVTGEVTSERGTRTVEKGRMSGTSLTWKTTQTRGTQTMEASYSLTVTEEKVEGTLSAGPMRMDLTGERTRKPEAGAEKKEGGQGEPAVTTAELEEALHLFRGPVKEMGLFAVTNAKVYTVSGETIENGTVVVRDGKIAAVGADVEIPGGAEVIDAQGGSLIPGIIDAHSHIAGEGGINEGSLAVTSMVTVQDILNPDDVAIYRALAGGVTTINLLHGSANPIGGGNAILKLRWGRDAAGLRFMGARPGIKFALGENPKRSRSAGRGPQRYPATRMGVMDVIRQAFTEAREYQKAWREYEAAKKAGKKALAPRRDFKLERLAEILEGRRDVHAHCYRADEILQLLRLAEEFGFRIRTLQHVLEGYKVADEIAAHGAGASTFSDWWGYKVEAYDAIPYNAALMTERGVVVSINSDSAEEMRHLNQEAGKAMKWGGISELEALKMVTLNPAVQLGIDARVGSIEVGKDADLTLYDGPPLSVLSVVSKTFVDGDLYFDREADRERQAAIDAIQEKLHPKDEKNDEGGGEEKPASSASRTMPRWDEPAYSCQEEGR